jgi:hypothetical protein
MRSHFNRIPLEQKMKYYPEQAAPTSEDINAAMSEFLVRGGTIQRMSTHEVANVYQRKAYSRNGMLPLMDDDMDFFNDFT